MKTKSLGDCDIPETIVLGLMLCCTPHLQVVPAPVMEPPLHSQGQEPLTASMLAAAPLMDQKQLLGVASFSSAPFVLSFMWIEATCAFGH